MPVSSPLLATPVMVSLAGQEQKAASGSAS